MIPKKIHYCWFGNNPKSKLIRKCIASWKEKLPDWEVIEWTEANYDVEKNDYVKEAYRQQKWAFVVDFARFDILREHGGIFLDADVEILKDIPEEILRNEVFTGFETASKVAPGLIFGAIPNHPILTDIIEVYNKKKFGETIDGRIENIVDIVTGILEEKGLVKDNSFQVVENVAIYPKEYFCCFDHETQSFDIKEETISIHHYAASWSRWNRKLYFRTIKVAAQILGKERYLKIKRMIKRKK